MLRVSQIRRTLMLLAVLGVGCTSSETPSGVPWLTTLDHDSHEPYFPINSGKHEGTDCNKCHGDFDTFKDFTCIGCHVHEQAETDPQHTAVPDYVYNGTSCLTCHPRGTADGSGVDHTPFYPIGEGTTHEAQDCGDCHIVPGDRAQVSCIDCHSHEQQAMAAEHGAMPGYAWQTQACLSCHRDGNALSRDVHDAIFPISMRTRHAETECSGCHIDANDQEAVTCVDCHEHEELEMATEHGPVGGYTYASGDCMKCHFDASVPDLQTHLPFKIDAASAHAPDKAECLGCHPSELPERPFPSADFTQAGCLGCHLQADMDPVHLGLLDYVYDSPTCLSCHIDGQILSRESHDLIFPVSMATAHGTTDCASCHADSSNAENVTCVGCHPHEQADSANAHNGVSGYQYDSPLCMRCHDTSEVFRLADHQPFRIDRNSKHKPERAQCLECHTDNNAGRPFPAADFELFNCLDCHRRGEMDDKHREERRYEYVSTTCVQSGCHPNGEED